MNEESSDKERNTLASCFFYGKDLGVGDPTVCENFYKIKRGGGTYNIKLIESI
jgi:hypothetical protein